MDISGVSTMDIEAQVHIFLLIAQHLKIFLKIENEKEGCLIDEDQETHQSCSAVGCRLPALDNTQNSIVTASW